MNEYEYEYKQKKKLIKWSTQNVRKAGKINKKSHITPHICVYNPIATYILLTIALLLYLPHSVGHTGQGSIIFCVWCHINVVTFNGQNLLSTTMRWSNQHNRQQQRMSIVALMTIFQRKTEKAKEIYSSYHENNRYLALKWCDFLSISNEKICSSRIDVRTKRQLAPL